MSQVILYADSDFSSPYAMSAYVALKVKGIAFDLQIIKLDEEEQKSNSFLEKSLTSRVPTLIDGDFSLSESSAISEYLEEIQPTPHLYPTSIHQRNRARQVQAWLRSDLLALRIERPTEVIFSKTTDQPLSASAAESVQKLYKVAEALLGSANINIFDSWSIADVDFSLMLNRLVANGDDVPEYLVKYVRHHWQHSAIQEWVSYSKDSS
jgi:glutathione S-transferase